MDKPPQTGLPGRGLPARWKTFALFAGALAAGWPLSGPAQPQPQRLNNLAALLLEASPTRADEAKLTVSDWPESGAPAAPFGQEQAFNFIEVQPYHE